MRELQSIVDYDYVGPSIDPAFGALSFFYWWSTSLAAYPGHAWNADFSFGNVNSAGKDDAVHHMENASPCWKKRFYGSCMASGKKGPREGFARNRCLDNTWLTSYYCGHGHAKVPRHPQDGEVRFPRAGGLPQCLEDL